jgi:radical SAM superfamily enzyme YgiQ (UPF0313 family)
MARKILLIMPPNNADLNSNDKPWWSLCRIPPIGLMSIASYLTSRGHETSIIDCRELITRFADRDYLTSISRLVKGSDYDVVGINMLTANFNTVDDIAYYIKILNRNVKVVLGGVHPSVESDLTLKQILCADAVCVGAGEDVMLDVAEGKEWRDIAGLKTRGNDYKKRECVEDIDKYPYPDYNLVNQGWYTKFSTYTITGFGFRGVSALTSRSCPYSCYFCASDWSKPFRYHSVEYVVGLAKHLAEMDVDVISFFDDTIGLKEDRLVSICEEFIKEKIFYPYTNLRWIGELRASQVSPRILKVMKKAGCFHIGMGIESGSDRMLKVINKKITVEENNDACRHVKEAGLHLGVSFMMGMPSETEDDMRATLKVMKQVDCNYMGVGSFRPLPGSRFFNELVEDKENIDWVNLGNFMVPPRYRYYDAPDRVFEQLYDEAYNYAYGRQWVTVHAQVASRNLMLIRDIADNIKIKMAITGSYYSDNHIDWHASRFVRLRTVAEKLYMSAPYIFRRMIRSMVHTIGRVHLFKMFVWRYM